jgi:hypothetical protein
VNAILNKEVEAVSSHVLQVSNFFKQGLFFAESGGLL